MELFFGKKKATPVVPTTNQAILKLKDTLELLNKRETHVSSLIVAEKNKAKQYLKEKKKAQALASLKRSKLLEKEVENILNSKFNIEVQIDQLAQTTINLEILKTMQATNQVFTSLESKINVDQVAETMDNIEEKMAEIGEMSEILGRPMGVLSLDENDIENEMKEMQSEIAEEQSKSAEADIRKQMTAVPTLIPPVSTGLNTVEAPAESVKENSEGDREDLEEREIAKLKLILN